MSKDPFLEHARLGARSATLIEYEEIPHLPRLRRRAREYALADLAHAVMLVEEGILSAERGARLLDGLLHILEHGLATRPELLLSRQQILSFQLRRHPEAHDPRQRSF